MSCDVTILAPDATAIVQDQEGNELARQDIASGATGVIPVNVGGGVLYTYPYDSFNTGQDVSYAEGDDKDIRDTVFAPEIASWDTSLVWSFPVLDQTDTTKLLRGSNPDGSGTNIFGNLERFTDENGLQVYANGLVIDHLTGLMIHRLNTFNSRNFLNALNYSNNLVVDIYNDFHWGNTLQWLSIMQNVSPQRNVINYNPFNFQGSNFENLTSTTVFASNNEYTNRVFDGGYIMTILLKGSSTSCINYSFRKAFTYNPTTKEMELS